MLCTVLSVVYYNTDERKIGILLIDYKLQPRPAGKKNENIINRATEDFVSSGVEKFGMVPVTYLGDHREVALEFFTTPLL